MQTSRLVALLLSVTAHLGLALAVDNGKAIARGGALPEKKSPASMQVQLRPAAIVIKAIEAAAPVQQPAKFEMKMEEQAPEPVLPSEQPVALAQNLDGGATNYPHDDVQIDELPFFSFLYPPGARYYRTAELTEKPQVVEDTTAGKALQLPDIFPQPAIVQLLINQQGEIDKVIIEEPAFLSEEARRFVIESFTNLKFRPGKLGKLPVNSQMRIEVKLESVVPLPVN